MIDQIVEQDLCAKAETLGEYLVSRLACLKKLGVVREIHGKGIFRGVEMTDRRLGPALKKTALENGIILRVDPSWFAVAPPLIAEEAHIDEMCHLIEKSLAERMKRYEALDGRNRAMRNHAISGHTPGWVGSPNTSARYGSRHALLFDSTGVVRR